MCKPRDLLFPLSGVATSEWLDFLGWCLKEQSLAELAKALLLLLCLRRSLPMISVLYAEGRGEEKEMNRGLVAG